MSNEDHDDDEREEGSPYALLTGHEPGSDAAISPEDIETHYDLGVAYAEMDLLEDAIAEFETVLIADPTHLRARAELAALRAQEGLPRRSRPPLLS